jgi:hypothetical protein
MNTYIKILKNVRPAKYTAYKFSYSSRMSPEDYLYNQREATLATQAQIATMLPLKNTNHGEGTTDEIGLIGVPLGLFPKITPRKNDRKKREIRLLHVGIRATPP